MADFEKQMIYTGIKYFGQKIFIESTGDELVDSALKSTFEDDYRRTGPIEIRREDVQIVLNWSKRQGSLFEEGG